jgi:uncharacterized membrane protein
MTSEPDTCRFEALIIPHRSLSGRGLRRLAITLGLCTALIGLRAWWLGAWPVLAVSVPELALVLFLLWLNAWRGRASELVLLDDRSLRIVRTDPSGSRREVILPNAWLTIELREAAGRHPRLMLRQRDRAEEVGATLAETEKRALAEALREALEALRNPRFDNPQLRV